MVSRIFSILTLVLMAPIIWAANINVQVDRDPVAINESFKIIFEVDESVGDTPDFSALQQDFEVLSRNQSSNMQIINGSISRQTRWTLIAMAKRTGKLTIPSIRIGSDNSPAVSVTVNQQAGNNDTASENKETFIEVEATPSSGYVQSQILYRIRFFRAVNVNGANMSEPEISGGEVVMEQLGDDSSYETHRNGRRYIVIERHYALFPQQSGTLTIEPIRMDVQIPVVARGVFDPFGQNSTTRRLKSKSITLDVKPIPVNGQSDIWLPASDLRLTENWSQQPKTFRVGEPITRTLTIKADGLTAAQLPSLSMGDSNNYKTYPDQPRLNDKRGSRGISGTRQEKIAIIPTQAGQLKLPEIKINWWNVNQGRMETATLPARTLEVAPGTTNTLTTQEPATVTITPEQTPIATTKNPRWLEKGLIIFFGLGWFITALAWYISRRNDSTRQHDKQNTNSRLQTSTTLSKVKSACLTSDAQQAKVELINWARHYWPDKPPANLGEIGKRLGNDVSIQIEQLNQALYSHESATWQGNALWQALSSAARRKPETKTKDQDLLLPLYP